MIRTNLFSDEGAHLGEAYYAAVPVVGDQVAVSRENGWELWLVEGVRHWPDRSATEGVGPVVNLKLSYVGDMDAEL